MFLVLLWVTTRTGFYAIVLKIHISYLILSSAATLYSPSQVSSTSITNNRAAVLNQFQNELHS